MEIPVTTLLIIFSFITLIPIIAKMIDMPVIVTEIVFGILLGKSLFNIIPENSDIINFFASFGLIYLMFLAGLELKIHRIFHEFGKALLIALFSICVPFFTGMFISKYIGIHPLIIGTIFSTTSLGLIYSLTKEFDLNEKFSKMLLKSVLLVDIGSIFILGFSLAYITEKGDVKIEFYYSLIAILSLFGIPFIIEKFNIKGIIKKYLSDKTRFEMEVRFSFALIFVLAALSEVLGFHAILGAFLAGMIVTEIISKTPLVQKKLESFGYGFFIPLFFIFVGAKIDLPSLFSNMENLGVLILIIVAGIVSKIIGAGVVSKLLGYSTRDSIVVGLLHAVRLSLIIAISEIGNKLGFINDNQFSMFVIFAIISTIVNPIICKFILNKKLTWKENTKKHIGGTGEPILDS